MLFVTTENKLFSDVMFFCINWALFMSNISNEISASMIINNENVPQVVFN